MIVNKMIYIVDIARNIWRNEPLQYIRVSVSQENKIWYCEVEGMSIDSEFLDTWAITKLNPNEIEPAIKIIRRINFGNEKVKYLDNGVELYVRSSPRIEKIKDSISALRNASFYKELHQEEGCSYSCILKNTIKAKEELKQFLNTYRNVRAYYDEGIYHMYM